jgi:galactoside O-acetyltransferase
MIKASFYSEEELRKIGFRKMGENVKISKKASIYSPEKISIGSNVRIDDFCILTGEIEIGSYIHIAAYVGLYGKYGIKIEDFSGLSGGVLVYSASDDYSGNYMTNPTIPQEFTNVIGGQVILQKHSIIGAGSIILPNVIIGEGAAVGAMSVVRKNLAPWKIYSGNPCRPIKSREQNILQLENQLIQNYN